MSPKKSIGHKERDAKNKQRMENLHSVTARYYLPNAEFLDFWCSMLEENSKMGMDEFITRLRKRFDKMSGTDTNGATTWQNSDAVADENVPNEDKVRAKMRNINKKMKDREKHPYYRGHGLRIPASSRMVRPPLDGVLETERERIRKIMKFKD
jgi:hypothetical protein